MRRPAVFLLFALLPTAALAQSGPPSAVEQNQAAA